MAETSGRRGRWRPRLLGAIAAGVMATLLGGGTVHADPAGPTDYESEVVALEPSTPSIEARIIGGDSFFELQVDEGTEVFVVGYEEGDDYLWFRADGVVFENQNSPSTYLNGDRYGGGDIPASAFAGAEPDWDQVATGGTWVWHDHRAHWMQASRPVGFSTGDQILDESIPLRVVDADGGATVDVAVRVTSTWLPAPSPWAAWLGAIAGVGLVAAAWAVRRRGVGPILVMVPATVLALVVGGWQYLSLPAATGPRPVWVVLPGIAVVCAVVGAALARRSGFAADAVSLVVGVELAVWGFVKRDGISAAIIPTDAPMWLDRFTTCLALAGGVTLASSAMWWLFVGVNGGEVGDVSGSRAPTDSPHPAHP